MIHFSYHVYILVSAANPFYTCKNKPTPPFSPLFRNVRFCIQRVAFFGFLAHVVAHYSFVRASLPPRRIYSVVPGQWKKHPLYISRQPKFCLASYLQLTGHRACTLRDTQLLYLTLTPHVYTRKHARIRTRVRPTGTRKLRFRRLRWTTASTVYSRKAAFVRLMEHAPEFMFTTQLHACPWSDNWRLADSKSPRGLNIYTRSCPVTIERISHTYRV